MKGALTSSSGTLYATAKKINHSGIERSQQLSVIVSNENLFVRLEIRNQVETASLCTAISRSALELVYAEVVKKLHHHEEEGTIDECSCTVRSQIIQKDADRIEKVRRCGSCHKVGHNRRKCPKLLNQHLSSQGADECGCVLTQTTNTIKEMAENGG
ncbi:hypothetical protein LIPSTDRAFT_74674 [Lipomyces starkeyi NRRL Y-11557]|uniref:CCHC-type domain-containing protein n=1 Tax=Lipomyces starkeyi NRRL Y-11557 TaxID=675824 RepID=A0A1E3PY62_LIPST|nr:hypothetical protein LIPSTDRAFT_74674 [Lipomyces starkeyi NRRL Y-11557]